MSSNQSPAMVSEDIAIKFDHVTKTYKLYKDDRQYFLEQEETRFGDNHRCQQ